MSLTIPPPCLFPFHILRPAGLLFPLFLPQDTVNALSDFLGFFHFLFQCKIDDVPLDYGAAKDGMCFPDALNGVLEKQMRKDDFLDVIFNCPYEIHEFVTEEYLSKILWELSEDHKEILFLHAVRAYSSKKIGEMRGQSDRNIRKVHNTMPKKIYKKLLSILTERMEKKLSMTNEEKQFVADMKKAVLDGGKGG